jgi:hypothetical protein
MAKTSNAIRKRAEADGREYITPEDIGDCINDGVPKPDIQAEVLHVLGGTGGYGAEDSELCAFVAWQCKRSKRSK